MTDPHLAELRQNEKGVHQALMNLIKEAADGEPRQYADVQNIIYLALFGASGKTLTELQRQHNGEVYKRGALTGELKPSDIAKDHLNEAQLVALHDAKNVVVSTLKLRFPRGGYTMDDIHDVAWDVRSLTPERVR